MFAYICFEEREKQGLFEKISERLKKPDYTKKIELKELDSFYIDVKIPFKKGEPQKKILKRIDSAFAKLKDQGIRGTLLNRKCEFYDYIKSLGFDVYDTSDFFKENVLNIIKFLSNKQNMEPRLTISVISDWKFENVNPEFLSRLTRVSHTIGIIAKESRRVFEFIDRLYEQKGIPVVLLQDFEMLKKAHLVILFDNAERILENRINNDAFVICADSEFKMQKYYSGIIITGFDLKLPEGIYLDVPNGISKMEFLGACSKYCNCGLILNLEISNIITNKQERYMNLFA